MYSSPWDTGASYCAARTRARTWKKVENSNRYDLFAVIAVPNTDVLIAVGDWGTVLRSSDAVGSSNRVSLVYRL
jgi:hypothetical protein